MNSQTTPSAFLRFGLPMALWTAAITFVVCVDLNPSHLAYGLFGFIVPGNPYSRDEWSFALINWTGWLFLLSPSVACLCRLRPKMVWTAAGALAVGLIVASVGNWNLGLSGALKAY